MPVFRLSTEFPYPFITVDAEKAASKTYDYIIVGGGTAGCPLAATLSANYSVLVVERGGSPYGVPDIENKNAFLNPLSKSNNYTSIAQTFVSEDGVAGARGRVLGGSTAINAGFYSRASLEYIRNMGWDEKLVNESYEWVEKQIAFRQDKLGPWQSAFKEALLDVGVIPYNGYTLDHIEGTKIGASIFDNNGKRHTAADLLKYANPQNIVVLLNATTKRILFHPQDSMYKLLRKPRASGVEFVDNEGVSHHVFLKESRRGNVIVSAGALGSPQLLLLSGIGPSHYLKSLHIPLVLDLPGVGQGMADNPGIRISMLSSRPVEESLIEVAGIAYNSQIYIEGGSTVQSYTQVEGEETKTKYNYTGIIFEKVAFPLSSGELRLRSLNPRDNPTVRFNYYSHPLDLQRCVQGVTLISKLFASKSILRFGYKDKSKTNKPKLRFLGRPMPQNTSDTAAMAQYCRDMLVTIWHNHGGCNIGSVINQRYRVMGIDGLMIVDAFTFKSAPGTNPQATTMMLGRYQGLQIHRQRQRVISK
eukprot:Gb_39928 [translate_table: standard]